MWLGTRLLWRICTKYGSPAGKKYRRSTWNMGRFVSCRFCMSCAAPWPQLDITFCGAFSKCTHRPHKELRVGVHCAVHNPNKFVMNSCDSRNACDPFVPHNVLRFLRFWVYLLHMFGIFQKVFVLCLGNSQTVSHIQYWGLGGGGGGGKLIRHSRGEKREEERGKSLVLRVRWTSCHHLLRALATFNVTCSLLSAEGSILRRGIS